VVEMRCDVVVLGMGTCGEDASLRLARSGLDVVGVEARLIGGECPYWACLPTKSLVRSAGLVAEARRADGLVGRVTVEAEWSIIARRLREEVTGGWEDSNGVARFEAAGGRFVRGWGTLTGPKTVSVGDTSIVARRGVVLATGSRPSVPLVPGLDEVPYWTNHEAVAAEELPSSLVVLGGGAVGCELGQVFARFGVDVTIVEGRERLLPGEEVEVSTVVADALAADGVAVLTGVGVAEIRGDDRSVVVRLDDGSEIEGARLLVATGRTADADALGVAAAGASTDGGFVRVDGRLRAADGLWAIGDVTGIGMLTEVALYQGTIAVEDVLGASPAEADYTVMPRAVFTDPEVGSVGCTEAEARAQGRDVTVLRKDLGATFRGWLHRTGNAGLLTLVVDRAEDRLVGASVVGPRATDVLGMLALAVQARTPLEVLARTIYAFPTFYGVIGEALGSYGRGLVGVLDPGAEPLFADPSPLQEADRGPAETDSEAG
jgi:pyruvate/2-oxoglutarate dehydrogenase complex dihydrolipoamide dehydrogenase (E3) component